MPYHFGYLWWVVYVAGGISGWKCVPLMVARLVAALTHDESRARQCLEVVRLSRRDAALIPSYLVSPAKIDKSVKPLDVKASRVLNISPQSGD
jgi:hypothetical protein